MFVARSDVFPQNDIPTKDDVLIQKNLQKIPCGNFGCPSIPTITLEVQNVNKK